MKLKKITFVSASGKYYWYVLYDGDTVGRIVNYATGWEFFWSVGEPYSRPVEVGDAIFTAAKEKELVLNIAKALTQ